MRIPLYRPMIGAAEAIAVARVIKSGWISHRSPEIRKFEEEFAATVGAKFAVAVSSGTAALHCALVAAGVKPGNEVIVPSLTYIATANAVVHAGARPRFADVDVETWCVTGETVTAALTAEAKFVVPVHLYGHPALILGRDRAVVIEDCAEALGTENSWDSATARAWSFFANKTITTGEGGMVTSDSVEVADAARRLAHQGLVPGTEYQHDRVGYNYRMTAMQAAFGRAQLRRLSGILKRKRMIAGWYREGLKGLPVRLQADHPGHSWWLVSGTFSEPESLREELHSRGIETRPVFPPITSQPAYAGYTRGLTPVANEIASKGISLPSWPGLKKEQVEFICDKIKEFYR